MRAFRGRSSSGYLAAYSVTRRSHMLSGVLAPVAVLVAATTGTLLMVGIDYRTMAASGDPTGAGETVSATEPSVSADETPPLRSCRMAVTASLYGKVSDVLKLSLLCKPDVERPPSLLLSRDPDSSPSGPITRNG